MSENKKEYRVKQGLYYMPLHTSEMRNLDVGSLVQQYGGAGWQVYKWIELLCIETNGYYLEWTEDSPKTVAHICYMQITQRNINFITEVVNYCLAKGFFSKTLFTEKNVITSRYLQEQFMKVLIDCKRKLIPILPELNLIPPKIQQEFKQNEPPVTEIYETEPQNLTQDFNNPTQDLANLPQDFENTTQDLQQKKRKEKEKKENSESSLSASGDEFTDFWEMYDKKNAPKDKVAAKWAKMSVADRAAALAFIPLYIEAQPDKTFRCNPYRYLNEKRWEQELIYSPKSQARQPAQNSKTKYYPKNQQNGEKDERF